MYPDEFDYYAAETVEEALSLLDEHAMVDAKLLAGGHSLIPTMKSGLSSPDVLIDIGGVDDLHGVDVEDGVLEIGAATRYVDVVESGLVREHAPAFHDAVSQVGDIQVRNRGTVGGNLAHADPASDLPGAVLAADATVVAAGPSGEREIPVDDFFFGMYATALDPDELLTRVEIPVVGTGGVGAYAKKASPSSGYAMVGVAARLVVDNGVVESARLGANGAMDYAVRLDPVEDAIVGESLDDDTIEAAAAHATDDLDPDLMLSDLQATGPFRAQLLGVFTERALRAAAEQG